MKINILFIIPAQLDGPPRAASYARTTYNLAWRQTKAGDAVTQLVCVTAVCTNQYQLLMIDDR